MSSVISLTICCPGEAARTSEWKKRRFPPRLVFIQTACFSLELGQPADKVRFFKILTCEDTGISYTISSNDEPLTSCVIFKQIMLHFYQFLSFFVSLLYHTFRVCQEVFSTFLFLWAMTPSKSIEKIGQSLPVTHGGHQFPTSLVTNCFPSWQLLL